MDQYTDDEKDLMFTLGADDAQAGCNPRDGHPWYVMGYNFNKLPHQPTAVEDDDDA